MVGVSGAVTVLDGPAEVLAAVGDHLGRSPWLTLTAERVELFVRATGGRDGFGAVAPGRSGNRTVPEFLILALSNLFLPQILEVRGFATGINTGTDRIRFPSRVPVGSRIRGGATLVAATELPDAAGIDTRVAVTIDVEGSTGPACEIESRSRWLS